MRETVHGKCPCRGKFETREVEIRITDDSGVRTLSRIPQGTCLYCGSRVYKVAVLELIELLVRAQ